jgi:hypothetical protein
VRGLHRPDDLLFHEEKMKTLIFIGKVLYIDIVQTWAAVWACHMPGY